GGPPPRERPAAAARAGALLPFPVGRRARPGRAARPPQVARPRRAGRPDLVAWSRPRRRGPVGWAGRRRPRGSWEVTGAGGHGPRGSRGGAARRRLGGRVGRPPGAPVR